MSTSPWWDNGKYLFYFLLFVCLIFLHVNINNHQRLWSFLYFGGGRIEKKENLEDEGKGSRMEASKVPLMTDKVASLCCLPLPDQLPSSSAWRRYKAVESWWPEMRGWRGRGKPASPTGLLLLDSTKGYSLPGIPIQLLILALIFQMRKLKLLEVSSPLCPRSFLQQEDRMQTLVLVTGSQVPEFSFQYLFEGEVCVFCSTALLTNFYKTIAKIIFLKKKKKGWRGMS